MISTVPNGSYSIQPRPGSCGISSSRYLRRAHLRTRLAAYFASAAVVAMSAMNASAALRSRSSASALAIASSFSSISFASCSNCRLRHSMSRVRPVAKVRRSRATVAGMSAGSTADPFVDCAFGATDSVVIIVLPEQSCPLRCGRPLIGDKRDPNHPVLERIRKDPTGGKAGCRVQELFDAGDACRGHLAEVSGRGGAITGAGGGHRGDLSGRRPIGRGTGMGQVVARGEPGSHGEPDGSGRHGVPRGRRQVQLIGQHPRALVGPGAVFDAAVVGWGPGSGGAPLGKTADGERVLDRGRKPVVCGRV